MEQLFHWNLYILPGQYLVIKTPVIKLWFVRGVLIFINNIVLIRFSTGSCTRSFVVMATGT